jgi:hypothetical protein
MTHEEIIAAVESMTVLELADLVKAMEEKFGVSAAATAVVAGRCSRCGRKDRVRRGAEVLRRRCEAEGSEARPRSVRSGPEGSQGLRRSRCGWPEDRQGRPVQGRRRQDGCPVQGSRRRMRNQVILRNYVSPSCNHQEKQRGWMLASSLFFMLSTRFVAVPLDFFAFLRDNKAGNSSIHPFYLKEVHGDADFSGRNR